MIETINEPTKLDYEILASGNMLAKTHARKIMGKRKLGRFLAVLVNPSRAAALKVKPEQLEAIKQVPVEDRNRILACREVVEKICKQYKVLTVKLAYKMARLTGRDNPADLEQLKSEATVGLLKAIRGYARTDIKFFTYCYRAITNEISRYLQRNGSTLPGVNSKLLVAYRRCYENLFKAGLPHDFDAVCREMKLKDKQIARLKRSISEISSESDLEESLSKLLLEDKPQMSVDTELIRRIESVPLSRLERDAWISQNDEIRGLFPDALPSLKAVAAAHGELTPQAASEALKRAKLKLARALGDWSPSKK